MKYDFTGYVDRSEINASKWLDMITRNPNVGKGVVPMSVADMDFYTAPEIKEEITKFVENETLGYTKPTDSYLESVRNFFSSYHGYDAKKEWITTTPGVVSALANSIKSFTEEGDGVLIFTPVYNPFYSVIEGQNRKIIECPLIYGKDRYSIDFDQFEELASQENTKLILLCSPHNPGGTVWNQSELERIADVAEENNLIVVSDEIHSDITFGDHTHTVFSTVNDTIGDRSIICTAASKTFNIAGLQCSNIFIENDEMRETFIENNVNVGLERANILGLVATKAAYDRGSDWLKEVKVVIENNLQIVENFFSKYDDLFPVMSPEASFTTWVNFENTEIDHEEFINFLDQKSEFFITDGLSFGENGRNFIRINVGLPTSKLNENLERLEKTLKSEYNIQKSQ